MNYYGAKELAAGFRTVRKNTITIAEEIGEQHYGFRPAPDTRTVGVTLVHIALTPRLQEQIHGVERRTTLEGFDFFAFMGNVMAEEQKPRTKSQIVAMLKDDGERFAKWMEGLSDDFLGQRVAYPAGMTPPIKSRFEMLLGVKEHEMHHRGQLMVIERMLGVVPHLTREMQARIAAMQSSKASA
ncbi:MAG TPA: DinB family protein [Bryobacteraceae bacterium]|nr:DinB family protein [Bryobacteraceae bacterium]